jgi:hypothetical protein
MYNKSLSGLSLVLLLNFSFILACNNSTPGTVNQQSTSKTISVPAQTVFDVIQKTNPALTGNNQSSGSAAGAGSNPAGGNGANTPNTGNGSNLNDQAADANPQAAPTVSPSPTISGSASPTPTSSPSNSFNGPSGQLNISINPSPPVPR